MGMFDLGVLGVITAESFAGEIFVVDGEVTITVEVGIQHRVFDPDNPDFEDGDVDRERGRDGSDHVAG